MMDTRTMQVLYLSLQRCCFVLWWLFIVGSHDLVIKAKEMSQFSSSSSSLRSRHYHPRRRRRRLELSIVSTSDSTVVTTPDIVDDDDDDTTSRGLEKTPIMSDPMDCSSFNETDFGGTLPCRRTNDTNPDFVPPMNRIENQVELAIYVGITENTKTVVPLLTAVVSHELDDDLTNMNFSALGSVYRLGYDKRLKQSGYFRDNIGEKSWDRPPPSPTENKENPGNRLLKGTLRTLMEERVMEFDMRHVKSPSRVIVQREDVRWWWLVNVTYRCYWGDNNEPVGQAVMAAIEQNMTSSFDDVRETVQGILQKITRDDKLRVRTHEQGVPSAEDDAEDVTSPIDSRRITDPPSQAPMAQTTTDDDESLDPREWDWRKYAGLGLLVSTLCCATMLRCLGARQQRTRQQRAVWGNLASEEGINTLLGTAWALEGSKMQVYDKTQMGYRDDDSIFLGGFEQKEAVVGAEIITETQPTTETPDTTPPSEFRGGTTTIPPSAISSKKSDSS